jgi:two-component system C4-dicarboxylate transport sensor histidine kinase DctB
MRKAFRGAHLIHERCQTEEQARKARDEFEIEVIENPAELQGTMAELTHLDRVVTTGLLSVSIVHEINQPLTAIVTEAGAARQPAGWGV